MHSFIRHSEGSYDSKFFAEASQVEAQREGHDEEALLFEEDFSEWPVIASDGATAALLSIISEGRVSPARALTLARQTTHTLVCSLGRV